jgi:hypothetical protein
LFGCFRHFQLKKQIINQGCYTTHADHSLSLTSTLKSIAGAFPGGH